VEAKEREALYYQSLSGEQPCRAWRNSLGDIKTKAAVDARIARFRSGNFGDSKPVGEGISEARIDHGPGYRIYYAVDGDKIILLCGGEKKTQDSDIKLAKALWSDYRTRTRQKGVNR
jgi:putative addiction module killer protein